jgi:hypothetical protein
MSTFRSSSVRQKYMIHIHYEAWNKPEKASELRTKFAQIEDFQE